MVDRTGSDIDFEKALKESEESVFEAEIGDVVTGEVTGVTADEVIVAVGLKSEGRIKLEEFASLGETPKRGDKIAVKILSKETEEGVCRLSRTKAAQDDRWTAVNEAFKNKTLVLGKVIGEIKGGFTVDIGLPFAAFLPRSQATLKRRATAEEVIGHEFEFEIREMDKRRKNIVLSRKSILETERNRLMSETLGKIQKDAIIEGTVKNITDFGVFVDIGGIDGLITLGDLSWGGFIKDANEVVKRGDKVNVKVLDYDPAITPPKIRLGLKQAQGDPWDKVIREIKPGETRDGKVKSFTNFGAFVEIIPGVDGLVHISEFSWTDHVKHPSHLLEIGQMVRVKVVSIDSEKKKVSLSIKQAMADPWSQALDEYQINSRVKGKITGVTNFGVFVRLPLGIEGMIHKSDIAWDDPNIDPQKLFSEGQEMEVVVLKIDAVQKKMSLGVKQTAADPWNDLTRQYQKNRVIEGEVVRVDEDGAWVKLDEKTEGFVPLPDLAVERVQHAAEAVKVGQTVRAKVTRLERKGMRIFLSIRELIREEEAASVKSYMSDQEKSGSVTIGDMIGDSKLAAQLQEFLNKQNQ